MIYPEYIGNICMHKLCFAHLDASSGPIVEKVTTNNQIGRESGYYHLRWVLDKTSNYSPIV